MTDKYLLTYEIGEADPFGIDWRPWHGLLHLNPDT